MEIMEGPKSVVRPKIAVANYFENDICRWKKCNCSKTFSLQVVVPKWLFWQIIMVCLIDHICYALTRYRDAPDSDL